MQLIESIIIQVGFTVISHHLTVTELRTATTKEMFLKNQ